MWCMRASAEEQNFLELVHAVSVSSFVNKVKEIGRR